MGLEGMKRVVDALAEARVFHLALGGGESLEVPWLFDLAEHVRARKIIPNLTTNGFCIDEETAPRCRIFGQINVSLDGIGEEGYRHSRGVEGFARADRALSLLRRAGCNAGINMVVSRRSFERLADVIRYARKKGVNQIELLRFKPAGRGRELFHEMDLTEGQARSFYPTVASLARRFRMRLRLDCSFMPMVFAHEPDIRRLDLFAISGCMGGEMLMGIDAEGRVNACSFAGPESWDVLNLSEWWYDRQAFLPFRTWLDCAPEPCASCTYQRLCRGGCHVVALAVRGTMAGPDPGCPLVRERGHALQ
jgi:radical SAM protein with 4Fe4S-binding SPASM domain